MIQEYLQKIKRTVGVKYLQAVVYARYSSDLQRSESIDAQLRIISDFAKQNNIIITHTYIDEAKSGKRDDRVNFQEMMKDAKVCNDWQIVLIHKLDRFARNRYDSANYRVQLRKNKKYLISVTEQLDDSPESLILESVIEAMAEYYSKNLAREVMKGLTENALQGKHCGGVPPLGYDVDKATKFYVINDFESQSVKLIYEMFLSGDSYGDIIGELNSRGYKTKFQAAFTKNSLYEILRNEKYTGTLIYNRTESRDEFTGRCSRRRWKSDDEIIRVENVLPVIIPKDTFSKVQEILKSRSKAHTNHAKEVYLLTGKIECGICGGSYTGTRKFNNKGIRYISYVCNIKHRSVNQRCNNKCVSRDWLEEVVLNAINNYIINFDDKCIDDVYKVYTNDSRYDEHTKILESELSNVNKQLERISEVISLSNSSTLLTKLSKYEEMKKEMEDKLVLLKKQDYEILTLDELKLNLLKFKQMLKEKSIPKIKELINLIVKKIIVYEDRIEIYLNFFSENNKFDSGFFLERKV